jgi:hypothetical protein
MNSGTQDHVVGDGLPARNFPGTHPRNDGSAQGGSGVVNNGVQIHTEDVSVNLFPQGRLTAPVRHHGSGEHNPAFLKNIRVVTKTEGDGFQHRPIQVSGGCTEVHSKERSPQIGIVQGAFFAQKIGQTQDTGWLALRCLLV